MKPPAHDFRTITDPDWARMLAAHRAQGHYHGSALLLQIRARVAAKFPELRQGSVTTERAKLGAPQNAICAPAGAAPCVGVVAQRKLGMSAHPFPRQSTAQSEHRPLITPVRRADAFPFTAAGSADRKGGGTPRAEAGGSERNFVGESVTTLPRPGGNEATEGDAGADVGGEFVLGKQSDREERLPKFQ